MGQKRFLIRSKSPVIDLVVNPLGDVTNVEDDVISLDALTEPLYRLLCMF